MMNINSNWLIFYAGLGLIVLELIIGVDTGFDLLLVGAAFIIGALGGFLFNNYVVALIISIIISILYLLVGRRFIKEKLHISTHKINIDALIGKEAVVIKPIVIAKPGQIKVANEIWRAEADQSFKIGDKVKIISVEGVTLKVAQQ